MMKKPFRQHHLELLLKSYKDSNLPLDLCINNYFREHTALGSKDRAEIADTIYGMIRWKGLLNFLSDGVDDIETQLKIYKELDLKACLERTDIPTHIRLSFPEDLYNLFVTNFGEEKAFEMCINNNQNAPFTIRINPSKTTRAEMLSLWKESYDVSACKIAPYGITFPKRTALMSLPEFRKGYFEVQDEGSQLLAELMQVEKGQQVMDFCSGSGGKTLAFAHKMKNSGQIYLHDIRSHILIEAKKRLRRAGVQNAQVIDSESPQLKKLKKQMDWILVDAPCSGTGTLRRNPNMKWTFSLEFLNKLIGQQRHIFEKALSYLAPHGRIVYATCSILREENQDQIEHFIKTYDLEIEGNPFQSLPSPDGMDGFFGAVLRKRCDK